MFSEELDNAGILTESSDGIENYVYPIREYCLKHEKNIADLTNEELMWFHRVNLLQGIVENITEWIVELKSKEHLTALEYGQLLAFVESLSIIRDACAGYDLTALGLDFDLDQKYL